MKEKDCLIISTFCGGILKQNDEGKNSPPVCCLPFKLQPVNFLRVLKIGVIFYVQNMGKELLIGEADVDIPLLLRFTPQKMYLFFSRDVEKTGRKEETDCKGSSAHTLRVAECPNW